MTRAERLNRQGKRHRLGRRMDALARAWDDMRAAVYAELLR